MNALEGRRWKKGEEKGTWKKVYKEEFEGFWGMVIFGSLWEEGRGNAVTKERREILRRGLTQKD